MEVIDLNMFAPPLYSMAKLPFAGSRLPFQHQLDEVQRDERIAAIPNLVGKRIGSEFFCRAAGGGRVRDGRGETHDEMGLARRLQRPQQLQGNGLR